MRQWIVSMFLVVLGTICMAQADDRPIAADSPDRAQSPSALTPIIKQTANVITRDLRNALLNAHKTGDAKAFAATFTQNGEYVDAKGVVFHGRQAIEDEFTTFFAETPGSTIDFEFTAIRAIADGVIASDGITRFKRTESAVPIPGRCQLVCTRESDKWLIASLRETDASSDVALHHVQVSQLEWMIGEWIAEGPHSQLHLSCRWDESGNYLLRDFTINVAGPGSKPLSGTQRIGYDPNSGHLKAWFFDSAGGYSDGYFNRDGDQWILRTSGVTSDGHITSTTNAFSRIDNHRTSSELIDRFVGGERIGGNEKLTFVRKPTRSPERSAQVERQNR